jgi:TPR repeat protein
MRTFLSRVLVAFAVVAIAGGSFDVALAAKRDKDKEKQAPAPTGPARRAFIVGVQRYSDGNIQQLSRTINDANDFAQDLQDAGFDKKNVKVVTDIKAKDAFDKEFDAFLATVQPGDDVVFYFSGHGFGVESEQTNYLLFAGLKSPFAYAQSKMSDDEKRNADIVRLRVSSYLDAYQQEEIPRSGVTVNDIQTKIAAKQPRTAFLILDACRSLVQADARDDTVRQHRGPDSGSRLVQARDVPKGFVLVFSASFGEQAIESFGRYDRRRNSLFTEVLRSEMQRPGQTSVDLAKRVKLMVRSIANKEGQQQEPEFVQNTANSDDFYFVPSIGNERFQISQDQCNGAQEDWDQIKSLRKRELFERHRRRFDGCATAELARRTLVELSLTADDVPDLPTAVADRPIADCDRFAADELDRARPPEVPGVAFDKIDAESAITACNKATADNPRIVRFLFNLGRAYQKLAARPGVDADERNAALRKAVGAYDDASKRGYVSALTTLAVMEENGEGTDVNQQDAANLLKRAAQQGHPLAMYNLALHYRDGIGAINRDLVQAYEWFAKSAESGFVSAMVELGDALRYGRGLNKKNPRRAVEWYQRAADAGSARAKLRLGQIYFAGSGDVQEDSNNIAPDYTLALLWFGRVAETGDSAAQYYLANIMELGLGLANQQPEIAERYWRLAAYGGDRTAQVEFAERLRDGFVLIKPENGPREGVTLLQRAMSQGSPRAALLLAEIYRKGDLDQQVDSLLAMKLAYQAISLAAQADPTTPEGNPFYEIAAGHLLAEMAKNGEAVDTTGRPRLTADEVDRLGRYYGQVDPEAKQVKIRRLEIPIGCGGGWSIRKKIWVWDWGRTESPTEPQFRNLERETGCSDNDVMRATLIDVFQQAKKNKVPFADLVDQRIKTAKAYFDNKGAHN